MTECVRACVCCSWTVAALNSTRANFCMSGADEDPVAGHRPLPIFRLSLRLFLINQRHVELCEDFQLALRSGPAAVHYVHRGEDAISDQFSDPDQKLTGTSYLIRSGLWLLIELRMLGPCDRAILIVKVSDV